MLGRLKMLELRGNKMITTKGIELPNLARLYVVSFYDSLCFFHFPCIPSYYFTKGNGSHEHSLICHKKLEALALYLNPAAVSSVGFRTVQDSLRMGFLILSGLDISESMMVVAENSTSSVHNHTFEQRFR